MVQGSSSKRPTLPQIYLILPIKIMKTTTIIKKKQGQYILWMVINHCCGPSTRTFICANGTAVFGTAASGACAADADDCDASVLRTKV